MKAILKTIEQWASESDDRVKLLIILVWAGFGVLAVMSTLIVAWVMLPPDFKLF